MIVCIATANMHSQGTDRTAQTIIIHAGRDFQVFIVYAMNAYTSLFVRNFLASLGVFRSN